MPSGSVNFMLDSVSVGNIGDYFCSESSCKCSTPARHILEFLRLHSTLRLHLQHMSCYTVERERAPPVQFPGATIAGTAVGDLCSTATSSTEQTDNGFWFWENWKCQSELKPHCLGQGSVMYTDTVLHCTVTLYCTVHLVALYLIRIRTRQEVYGQI